MDILSMNHQQLLNAAGEVELTRKLDRMSLLDLQAYLARIQELQYNNDTSPVAGASYNLDGFTLSSLELSNLRLSVFERIRESASDTLVDYIDQQPAEQATGPVYDSEIARLEAELRSHPGDEGLQSELGMWQTTKRNTERSISDYETRQQELADNNDDVETAQKIVLGIYD